MTLEEKFASGIIVEEVNGDYVCELWDASTKHPDASFRYSEWEDKSPYLEDEYQIFQWLLWIASRRQWPFHAKELAEYALKNWYNWG